MATVVSKAVRGDGLLWTGAFGAVALILLAVHGSAMAADPNGSQIIWDDPPPPTSTAGSAGTTQPPAGSSSPIRDNFNRPAAPGAGSGSEKGNITWNKPVGRPGANAPPTTDSMAPGPCREFQQRVVIEGRPQQVHGRACRQTDGSWRIVN